MIPEIIVCSFNIYARNGVARTPRYFPLTLEFPATSGGTMMYKLVGQIEHSGSLAGGHYWARGLRKNGVFRLNDTSTAPSTFETTSGTYIVAYHYDRTVE
jgi:ubiquitin C-terminal hydrolase